MPKKKPSRKGRSSLSHTCAVALGRKGGLATARKRRAAKARRRK